MRPDESETVHTRWTLVERLKDTGDQDAWREFRDLYSRWILQVVLRAGLREHEAEEVAQETFISVSRHIQKFEANPGRGSFKAWLFQMVRWRIADQFRKRLPVSAGRRPEPDPTVTTPTVERVADPRDADLETLCDAEWHDQLLQKALRQLPFEVKASHYQIFHLLTVEGKSAAEVARMVGRNRTHVYLVKHRVGRILKGIVRGLETQLG